MTDKTEDYTLPSDPKDRKKIKDAIYEMSGVLQQMDDKRSFMKDIAKGLKEEYGLPPKVSAKMAKTVFKHNYKDVLAESSTFEVVYENLFETGNGT